MIKLEITKSDDPNACGIYEFQYDVISIGRSFKNDVILNEKTIPQFSFILYIDKNQLFLQTNSSETFCLVNNTKLAGKKLVKNNDSIKIGNSELKTLEFEQTQIEINFAEYYENFINTQKKYLHILEAIDEEIQKMAAVQDS